MYFVGNQPEFATTLVEATEEDEDGEGGAVGSRRCRIVLVPEFCESGLVVLVNPATLEVKTVQFDA